MLVPQPLTAEYVDGANSYVSLASNIDDVFSARDYLTDRGITTEITEGQLLRGAEYVNSFRERFKGFKVTPVTSSMQWPRFFVIIDEYFLDARHIPEVIPKAQIEVALEIANGRDPHSTIDMRVVKKKRVDVIETEYDTRLQRLETFDYRRIKALLRPVLKQTWGLVSR